jgi:hypothetical protein
MQADVGGYGNRGAARGRARARERRAAASGLEYVDFGGGWGVDYGRAAERSRPVAFVTAALGVLAPRRVEDLRLLSSNPGRALGRAVRHPGRARGPGARSPPNGAG